MSFYDDEAIAQERFDADCDMSDLIEAGNEAARLIREGDKLRAAGRHFDAAKRCPHNGGYGLSGTMATDRNDPHAGTLGFRCCDCGARMDRDPWVEGARIRSVEPDMIDGR